MAFPSSECPIRCLICGTNYIVENINTFFYPPILLTVSSLRVGIMHFHTVYEKKYDFHCRPLRYSKDHFILPLYQLKLVLISCLAGETLNFSQWWASALPPPPWSNIELKREAGTWAWSRHLSRVMSAMVFTAQAHLVKLKQGAPPPPVFFQSPV